MAGKLVKGGNSIAYSVGVYCIHDIWLNSFNKLLGSITLYTLCCETWNVWKTRTEIQSWVSVVLGCSDKANHTRAKGYLPIVPVLHSGVSKTFCEWVTLNLQPCDLRMQGVNDCKNYMKKDGHPSFFISFRLFYLLSHGELKIYNLSGTWASLFWLYSPVGFDRQWLRWTESLQIQRSC